MDAVEEKANTLSRAGSFYYNSLSESNKKDAEILSHLTYTCRAFQQLKNAQSAVLSGGYFDDHYKVIRFSDKNIIYFGAYPAYQKRVVSKAGSVIGTGREEFLKWAHGFFGYVIAGIEGVLIDEADSLPILTEKGPEVLDNESIRSDHGAGAKEFDNTAETGNELPVLFPDVNKGPFVQPSLAPIFGLTVDKDILVNTIQLSDGTELRRGIDFNSYYGLLIMKANPVVLFSGMKFMASQYTYRRRNLLCYTLGVDYVCGPVDRIVRYYRNVQSPRAFYLAAAQACGMAVVREAAVVDRVLKMFSGVSYVMSNGDRYDVNYKHDPLSVGTALSEGYVIGGEKLFTCLFPGDMSVKSLDGIKLKNSVPVRGLIASNVVGTLFNDDGVFQPDLAYDVEEGDESGPAKYKAYLRELDRHVENAPATGNVMQYFLNNILGNKYIIIRIDKSSMPKDMLNRLLTFIDREAPIGSVLLEADLQHAGD